jgi:hypothetical protein
MVALAVIAVAILGAPGGEAATPTFSTTVNFRIVYQPDCTFTVAVDGGATMASATQTGATLPPGPYQVTIQTPLPDGMWDSPICNYATFSLTGPGVSYSAVLGTPLGPYGASFSQTFQPASTYTMVDASQPNDVVTFTTTATGSSSSLLPPPPAPVSTVQTATSQGDLVGSAVVSNRGVLNATVTASGAVKLTLHGKPVVSLPSGTYEIAVADDFAKAGLSIEKRGLAAQKLTGVAFKGRRTVTVDLTDGTWVYYAKSDEKNSFVVTK